MGRASLGGNVVDESGVWIVGIWRSVCDFCAGEEWNSKVCIGYSVCGIGDMGVLEGDEEKVVAFCGGTSGSSGYPRYCKKQSISFLLSS
jgi:hypothetical protein